MMWPLNILDINFLILITAVISHLVIVLALRDVKVKIPPAVRKGEKAILKCSYDMEGDSLYSVKWYKGRREFYRYTPKENPAMKTFQAPGVRVERHMSNESQLTLESVGLITSGKYSCEVSADAPSFHTLISSGELEVVETPNQKPIITGIHSRYRVGDIVRGNCTIRNSKPAANLTWTINDHEANPSLIRTHKPIHDSRGSGIGGDLETSISQIQFVVTPQHFVRGKLKIRCTASLYDIYWQSTEKSIEEIAPKLILNSNSVNLIQSNPYDQYSLQDGDIVDKKDTYMTHIQGDMSSLNSGTGTLSPVIFTTAYYTITSPLSLSLSSLSSSTSSSSSSKSTSLFMITISLCLYHHHHISTVYVFFIILLSLCILCNIHRILQHMQIVNIS